MLCDPLDPHQIRADLLINCFSGEYGQKGREHADRHRQAHSRLPGAKPRLAGIIETQRKKDTYRRPGVQASRRHRACLVMSSAFGLASISCFFSSPTRGSPQTRLQQGIGRHRHGIIPRMRYMQVTQHGSCTVVQMGSVRCPAQRAGSGLLPRHGEYVHQAHLNRHRRHSSKQYGVQRSAIRCSRAPEEVGTGSRQGGRAVRRVATAGIRFRIPLHHEVTTIPRW